MNLLQSAALLAALPVGLLACDSGDDPSLWQGSQSLSWADATLLGQQVGHCVDGAGDVDHDGYPDVLVGGSGAEEAGAVYLARGPLEGEQQLADVAWATMTGEQSGDDAGTSLAGAGDVDGDGWMDLWVGAPGYRQGAGAVYLLHGPVANTVPLIDAEQVWYSDTEADALGTWMDPVGDMDGDGVGDLLVGVPGMNGYSLDSGGAVILPGVSASSTPRVRTAREAIATIQADFWGQRVGTALSSAGDVDGDGVGDILLGSPQDDRYATGAGVAYLLLGPVTGTVSLADADGEFRGLDELESVGTAVSGAGDMDGDGLDDILVGAPLAEGGAGAVAIFWGPATGSWRLQTAPARLVGGADIELAGVVLSGAGDMNADGFADLAIGMGEDPTSLQSVAPTLCLVLGPVVGTNTLSDADALLWADPGISTISSLAAVGDMDLDGRGDLLVGMEGDGSGGAYLLLGKGL